MVKNIYLYIQSPRFNFLLFNIACIERKTKQKSANKLTL